MKKCLICLALVAAVFATSQEAVAGWPFHHRHHVYQAAYPAMAYQQPYYQAPQAPQYVVMQAPSVQSSLVETLLPLIVDLARERPLLRRRGGDIDSGSDSGSGGGGRIENLDDANATLLGLKTQLSDLSTAVENVSTKVTRHGEEIVQLRSDVEDIKEQLAAVHQQTTEEIPNKIDSVLLHQEKLLLDAKKKLNEGLSSALTTQLDKSLMDVQGLTEEGRGKVKNDSLESVRKVLDEHFGKGP
jgi:hypothetical protein